MGKLIQARIDAKAEKQLEMLVRETGWSRSRAVREGLRLLAAMTKRKGKLQIAGLGQFSSGVHDLGSNKKHLEGFGE